MLNIHRSTRGQHYASRKQYGDETRNPEPAYQTRRARSYRSSGESQRENRTDFVLEAARAAAEEALIEQRIIMADPEAYQEFLVRLDQTPSPNAALRKTMQTPAPWEQEK